jgi:hypothetical protein
MSNRPGGEFRGPVQRADEWGWNRIDADRPRLPLIGLFLILFGGLLLLGQFVPSTRLIGSGLMVGVGLVLIALWAAKRTGTVGLYAGVILTALSLPNLLRDLGLIGEGSGWGTLFLGLGFVGIGLVRASSRGGTGWQMIVGIVLTLLGGFQVFARQLPGSPSADGLLWPLAIVVLGVWFISRSRRPGGVNRP